MITPLNVLSVPDALVIGIYKVKGEPNKMPSRCRRLHPQAYGAYAGMMASTGGLVVSDMFRTPESSLEAVKAKRGALPPSYSGHGYGFSIDFEVDAVMKRNGFKTKASLDDWMKSFGWFCHRLDGKRGFEDWHYDFSVDGVLPGLIRKGDRSMQPARERMLRLHYEKAWALSNKQAQEALQLLGLYSGEIDGIIGKISTQGILAFQRAWELSTSGKLDDRTKRVLWFVAANKMLPPVTV